VYDICCAELQAKLKLNRELADKAFERELSAKRSKLSVEEPLAVGTASMQVDEPAVGDDPTDEDSIALAQALKLSVAGKSADVTSIAPTHAQPPKPVAVGHHLPAGFTGLYELHGLVTHKGRSADSGHYIGWVRQGLGSSLWWCFNDNKVTEVRTEDVLALKGGGDRDMAYLVFYRCKE
jgi:ubiquitin carboxyl-terminal hydrolase 14